MLLLKIMRIKIREYEILSYILDLFFFNVI